MKTNVLISFLLLACVDAIGQQQDRLLHYETERAIYVYPDNPGYRDANILKNLVGYGFSLIIKISQKKVL